MTEKFVLCSLRLSSVQRLAQGQRSWETLCFLLCIDSLAAGKDSPPFYCNCGDLEDFSYTDWGFQAEGLPTVSCGGPQRAERSAEMFPSTHSWCFCKGISVSIPLFMSLNNSIFITLEEYKKQHHMQQNNFRKCEIARGEFLSPSGPAPNIPRDVRQLPVGPWISLASWRSYRFSTYITSREGTMD